MTRRLKAPCLVLLVLAAPDAACAQPVASDAGLDRYRRAVSATEAALAAHGGVEPILKEGATLTLEGTFDLTTRLQGRSDLVAEPTPLAQSIAIEAGTGRVAHTVRWHNYFHSRQHYTEVFDAGRALYVDHVNASAGWMPGFAVAPDAAQRIRRYLPHLVLAEALDARRGLAWLGALPFGGARADAVAFTTEAGELITVYLDPANHLARGMSTVMAMPILGDTLVEWEWSEYGDARPRVPGRMVTRLGGRMLADVRLTMVTGARPQSFTAPRSMAVPPPPAAPAVAPAPFVPYGQREPRVETVAPGMHLVRSLRPGFHLLFVEFPDFVVAVDAPTGWYEMFAIPPWLSSTGDGISDLGSKYLRAIRQTVPNKPIRHVVLTHHHSDHIGGIRPFIAEGVEVVAGAAAARLAGQAARATFSLSPDLLSGRPVAPAIGVVQGRRVIAGGDMEMQLLELPAGNPKADHYLMVYLPRQRILYTTAFIYPLPEADFPPLESIDLSIYFVDWLDRSGLDVERVLNVHGTGVVEPWHLDRIRALAAARATGAP
jgi:glyoxylase-like metal-dependent hydrolase (beta-lactamase superfamily II)